MNILVTGGAGFIGFHVAQALLKRGDSVVIVDNLSDYYDVQLKKDRLQQIKDKIHFYQVDIADYDALKAVFATHRFDKVCHLAAQAGVRYSLTNPFVYEKSNNLGMLNLLELLREFQIKHLVYASSSSVYGGNTKIPFSVDDPVDRPLSLYAATKRTNELYARVYHDLYGIDSFGLRFFTVYGPWGRPDMALFGFTKAILASEPITLYNYGKMQRDFTFIADIVDGVVRSLDNVAGCEILNLGNAHPVALSHFVRCIEKTLGKTAIRKMASLQPGDVPVTFADIQKTTQLLGWEPTTKIEDGIPAFVTWYKQYYGIRD